MYYDVYKTRGNDLGELATVSRSRGFDNPGPIVAFPPNKDVFPRLASPGAFKPGVRVLIPWRLDLVRKTLATMEHLAEETASYARKLIEEQHQNKEEFEHFLVMIDTVAMLANVAGSIGYIATKAAGEGGVLEAEEMTRWLLESHAHIAADITALAIPAPSQPKMNYRVYFRLATGVVTPSFYYSTAMAIATGNFELFLYGPAAIEHQTCLKIKDQADRDITRLKLKIQAARQQLSMPFYSARV